MRKFVKRILSVSLIAAMAVSFTGCGSSDSGSSAKKNDDGTVAVTLGTTSWPTNMFYYLAEEKGFFEKYGADVTVRDFASTTESTNAIVGGQIDFCTFASSETIAPYAQGAEFKIVLETDKSNGCEGLVATSDIKTVKDLKGKTVATQLYSVDHMFLLTLLEQNGMSEDDISIVDMSIQESGNAFVAGQCDAACIWDPYFSQAKDAGGTELFSSADNPDLITDSLAATTAICEDNPEVVKAVIKGFFDAVEYWKENPEEANEFMGKKLGVDAEEFAAEMEGLLVPTEEEVIKAFTEADNYSYWGYTQNTIKDFMYELGVLDSKDFDCGDMLDTSFIKEVAADK